MIKVVCESSEYKRACECFAETFRIVTVFLMPAEHSSHAHFLIETVVQVLIVKMGKKHRYANSFLSDFIIAE